jgi:hypothetical protein
VNRTSARLLALPVALALTATLSGCGTGFLAATNRPYVPSNGTSLTVGTMDARNLLLVEDASRPGTFHLIGALVNTGPDPEVLTGVSVAGASAVPLTPITVPGRSIITTGATTSSTIDVPGATFKVGDFTQITLTFKNEGSGTASLLALTPDGVVSGG